MRILWLKTGPLHPLNTGGKIRTCNMLRALRKDHQVTYLSLYSPDTPQSDLDGGSDYADDCIWVEHAVTDKRSPKFILEVATEVSGLSFLGEWVRVVDDEGRRGWVFHSLIDSRR